MMMTTTPAASQDYVDVLVSLLQTCLAPNISAQARQQAHVQLEQFKQRPDILELCLDLYAREAGRAQQARDFVLQFALRTCITLVRLYYPSFPADKSTALKNHLLTICDHTMQCSRLVESSIVSLGVEILKQEPNHAALFDALTSRLKQNQTTSTTTCSALVTRIFCEFSESIFEDEEDVVMTSARKSLLSKYLNSHFSIDVLPLALLRIEYELSVMNNEQALVQALVLTSECLRWNPTLQQTVETNVLALLERCCENVHFPTSIIQASFVALKHYCWNGKVKHVAMYALVQKQIVHRAPAQYHNAQEFQAGNDVFITLVSRHHANLPKAWQSDLERMTQLGVSAIVLNDYLGLWKDLIAKRQVVISHSWILTLVRLCLVADEVGDGGRGEEDGEEEGEGEAFESQKPVLMKELMKQHADSMFPIVIEALKQATVGAQQWFLVENACNGLSDKQLDQVGNAKTALGRFAEQLLDLVFAKRPKTLAELKVLHAAHAVFERRTAFLGKALEYYVDCAVDAALPSVVKKRAACHLLEALRKKNAAAMSKDLFVLPALVQRVSSVFPTLVGPERFVLLECVLVAGNALPSEAERIELTRQVLAEPFQTLNETGPGVLQASFILPPTAAATASSSSPHTKPWDQRGYFADMERLPDQSRRFITALMTISTCAKDGQLTEQMWQQLLPIAVACLDKLNALWAAPAAAAAAPTQHFLVIHPVDAKMVFGSRVAETMETFMDNLVEFGERVLKPEGMAIVTLLSGVRTCCLELVREAQVKFPGLVTPGVVRQLFQTCDVMEHRHLALLLNHMLKYPAGNATAERVFLHQICQHVANDRLRRSLAPMPIAATTSWLVRTPGQQEFADEINAAARRMLELAFVRFLAAMPIEAHGEVQFQWLLERLVFAEDQTALRVAGAAIMDRYMSVMGENALAKLALPACIQAFPLHKEGASRVCVGDIFTDAICRLAFRIPVRDFHLRTKPKGGKKTPGSGGGANFVLIQAAFPPHQHKLVSNLARELDGGNVTSEKTFRHCAINLLETATMPATAAAAVAAEAEKAGKNKKKKKNKKGTTPPPPLSDATTTTTATATAAIPPWQLATDARDLGMMALFGGVDNDDDL